MQWDRPYSATELQQAGAERIVGSGEMTELVRRHNWAATPLGSIDSWSPELVAAVNLTLCSSMPTRIMWGPDLLLIYNDAYRPYPGKRHPDALGRPARVVYRESWAIVGPLLQQAYATGESIPRTRLKVPIETDHGLRDFYLDYTFTPIFERGRIGGLFGFLLDVTPEVHAARTIREQNARASRVLKSIGDAVIVTDRAGRILQMNPVAQSLTGWNLRDAIDRPLDEVCRIEDEVTGRPLQPSTEETRHQPREVLSARSPFLVRRDGSKVPVGDKQSPILDDDGNVTGSVLVFRDLGEPHAAERERNQIADQLSLVLDATTDGVLSLDRDWRMVYRNHRAQDMLKASGALIGRLFWETFPEAVYPGSPFVENYYKTMNERVPTTFEAFYPHPHNAWYSVEAQPAPHGIVVFFHDITRQKLEAQALRESEARLKAIYRVSLELIGLLTPDGCVVECNRALLEFAGVRREQVAATNFADGPWFAATPGAPEVIRDGIAMAQQGKTVRRELALNRPNDDVVIVDFSLTPVFDDAGSVIYIVPEGRDITEARRAESALLQSEKLAAVGRLASSIAHEINNPLESVMNLIYLARHGDPADVRQFLDMADQEIRRVSIIANQTLRFHKQANRPQAVAAEDLFATVMSIYEGRLRTANVQVERDFRAAEPVRCFPGDVRQVLNNLVSNALEAMPFGGRLLIRSRQGRDWKTGRAGMILTIADNGSGIPEGARRHIFEAFFTTKGTAGNGLGLWVCQEIVQRYQGSLRVRSCTREGRSGTTFTLFLPADPPEVISATK